MNKIGQLGGVAYFIMMIVGLIIAAPIILKVGLTILEQTSSHLETIDTTNKSSTEVTFVKNKIIGVFDWFIMVLILINLLVLLISAFLIDVNPAFVVLYIIGAFALVLTAPYTIAVAEKIYSMTDTPSNFAGSTGVIQYIPMTEFVLNNFGTIIVGILVLSGIIIFAKIKFSSQGGTSGTY